MAYDPGMSDQGICRHAIYLTLSIASGDSASGGEGWQARIVSHGGTQARCLTVVCKLQRSEVKVNGSDGDRARGMLLEGAGDAFGGQGCCGTDGSGLLARRLLRA